MAWVRVLGFDRSVRVPWCSHFRSVIGQGCRTAVAGTVVRFVGHGACVVIFSWHKLGQVRWHGLVTWRASVRVRAKGRGTDGWHGERRGTVLYFAKSREGSEGRG